MSSDAAPKTAGQAASALDGFGSCLERLARLLAGVACVSLLFMVAVTTADVVLRVFRLALPGAYDLVRIATAITIAAALPYTTAVKGHVAIEYFFHKLSRRGRVVVDTIMRLLTMLLFVLLAWGCVVYGTTLKTKGEVSMTLQLPVFWVPYIVAASCGLVVLITLYHLLHPGRELIKP
ncbi:MAG TPA: TRAP transporter small permease [Verrucomicrobiota bacterium]|nr:TRAP transporter small permease [Verrucomicrobiota bacterium]HNU49974.1 TRAP transporter small permease [Verrucomicrobiota bacterium]